MAGNTSKIDTFMLVVNYVSVWGIRIQIQKDLSVRHGYVRNEQNMTGYQCRKNILTEGIETNSIKKYRAVWTAQINACGDSRLRGR